MYKNLGRADILKEAGLPTHERVCNRQNEVAALRKRSSCLKLLLVLVRFVYLLLFTAELKWVRSQ